MLKNLLFYVDQKNPSEESCQMALEDVNEVVSVVHHIVENSKPVTLDSEEDAALDIQQDFMQVTSADDSESIKHYIFYNSQLLF